MPKQAEGRVIAEKHRNAHHPHTVINKNGTGCHGILQERNLIVNKEEVCHASDVVGKSTKGADTTPSTLMKHLENGKTINLLNTA